MLHDELDSVNAAIKLVLESSTGVLDKEFLHSSVSVLEPKNPVCVREEATLAEVLQQLREGKIGCVLVVDGSGVLTGIFSERDFLLKVAKEYEHVQNQPVAKFMTPHPVTESMACTMAFALNLMSHGGFRHLPIVDGDNRPTGIVSVKDVVDYLVQSLMKDLMEFETS